MCRRVVLAANCVFYNEDRVNDDGVQVWCDRWDDWVRGDHYCNAWEAAVEARPYHDDEDEDRQVDLTVPAYIREAASQGLAYHAEGLSGSGVVERTLREARQMARGECRSRQGGACVRVGGTSPC
jgi:hypothetical protein